MPHRHNCCCEEIADAIRNLTLVIKSCCGSDKKGVQFNIAFGLPEDKTKEHVMVESTITNEQKVTVTLNPVTDTGKPAKLDGVPKWSVVSGDSAVVAALDGLSADLVSSDTPGDTTFLIDGDADLGSGVVDVQETILLHVAGAQAKNLGVKIGTPVAKTGVI